MSGSMPSAKYTVASPSAMTPSRRTRHIALPARCPLPPQLRCAVSDAPGEFTFRLLDAISYNPDPHNGHKVRVAGYMVRLGAEIRVNITSLQMVGTSCGQ